MRPSNTGKSDPQQPAPAKRGFFAAAGERLKRAMSGARAPDVAAPSAQVAADGADGEVTTSVQAKARELLLQDRTTRRGSVSQPSTPPTDAVEETTGARQRRTSPPPLPSQRTAAGAPPDAISGNTERASTSRPKRPVRDSKSDALRARLGAAKAALAEAQAKRAAEQVSAPENTAQSEDTEPEASAAEAVSEDAQTQQPTAASTERVDAQPAAADDDGAEPIRTLTIARLLARQGYYDRSLSIYDELLSENAEDSELRAEADQVRAKQSDQPGDASS
jgi:NADH-quinone oxidoreductase subunit C